METIKENPTDLPNTNHATGQWMTIPEFAKVAGVSTQAIYKRLTTSLLKYTKVVNGKKQVNSDALRLFENARLTTIVDNESEGLTTIVDNVDNELSTENTKIREQVAEIEKALAVAMAERDAERRRADTAEAREKEQSQTINALTAALQTAQQQAEDLTAALTAAQALHAGTMQKQLTMQDEKPKGFLGWLFGKKKKENNDEISG